MKSRIFDLQSPISYLDYTENTVTGLILPKASHNPLECN